MKFLYFDIRSKQDVNGFMKWRKNGDKKGNNEERRMMEQHRRLYFQRNSDNRSKEG